MKKPSLIFSLLAVNTINLMVASTVIAQTTGSQTGTKLEKQDDEVAVLKKQKESRWSKFTKELKNSKISGSVDLPTNILTESFGLTGKYQLKSERNDQGHYSGIDSWKINLSTYPGFVGMDVREESGTGLALGYDVTFIQQFDTQKESLLRLPYDPITKLPFTADVFDQTKDGKPLN